MLLSGEYGSRVSLRPVVGLPHDCDGSSPAQVTGVLSRCSHVVGVVLASVLFVCQTRALNAV